MSVSFTMPVVIQSCCMFSSSHICPSSCLVVDYDCTHCLQCYTRGWLLEWRRESRVWDWKRTRGLEKTWQLLSVKSPKILGCPWVSRMENGRLRQNSTLRDLPEISARRLFFSETVGSWKSQREERPWSPKMNCLGLAWKSSESKKSGLEGLGGKQNREDLFRKKRWTIEACNWTRTYQISV